MRKSLELNYELVLPIAGGARSYWIDYVMGDGATSIVYKAHYYDDGNNFHEVIIKECYPYSARITRQEASLVWEDPQEQTDALEAFQDAHKKLSSIHLQNKLRNSTSAAMEICSANNTLYSVQHLVAGITYDKDNTKKLEDILETTLALTKVIAEYHNLNMLHLDIKPENFMVLPETKQMAVLFDVDTVTSLNAISDGSVKAVPSSEGWAAPEQLSGKLDQLCPATDLFAIGACLFNKVVGRKVTAEDTGIFAQWDFLESITENANPQAIRLVRNILRKTIAASIRRRYQTAQELIAALEDAVKVAREDVFVISNCPPSMAQFIGREDELAKIHDHFNTGCRAVFLYGFGGMGKTELSKKYAECFGQEYDACVFHMYQPEDGLKKYMEQITIHNSDAKDHEKTLQATLQKSKVLLIVDNFDVDDDEHLMDLLALNADILFTTRNDHSDLVSDSIRILNLDALPMGQLLVLFQRELGRPMSLEDLQAAQKIIESVDNWTMIVPIIAKQIVSSGKTISEYAEMMENDGFRSLNEDTEEIRIRYHGKLYRKTPMEILRYVFDVGALGKKELEALCNVSVLRYHKALSKERYRHYTGAKNLNALNHIISSGWAQYDVINDTISLHPTVIELVESDIQRTPALLPGLFQHIHGIFESLEDAEKLEDAKKITFALLTLTELELTQEESKPLYLKLADFISRFYRGNIPQLYDLLFEAPEESTWHMYVDSVMRECILAALNEGNSLTPPMLSVMVARYAFAIREGKQDSFKIFAAPHLNGSLEDSAVVVEWIEEFLPMLNVYASIMAEPRIKPDGSVSSIYRDPSAWGLSLADHPFAYDYFRHVLNATVIILNLVKDHKLDGYEHLFDLANKLIIQIEESLGRFSFYNLNHERILEYVSPTEEEYTLQVEQFKKTHYTKKAATWYLTLVQTIDSANDPFPIYKLILNGEYELSRSQAAALLNNNFASKLLLDHRLTGEQKRYLANEFCAEQVNMLRVIHCPRPTRIKGLAKTHKNLLTLYAQLLSGAELLLEDVYTWGEEHIRIDIYRAAFILKRTIGVEILDPKPYILFDIGPHYHLVYFLAEFFELAEWTRTSGYIKQSKQMKTAILDSCLELDFDSMKEVDIQNVLFRIEPLARNYKRQDVIDLLSKQHNVRRSFFVDLLDTHKLTQSQKVQAVSDLTSELLWQLCDYHYDKTVMSAEEFAELGCYHTCECQLYTDVFVSAYSKIRSVFAQGAHVGVDLCAAMVIPDLVGEKQSWSFLENAQWKLERLIRSDEYAIYNEHEEIDGLVYLIFEQANLKLLASEAKDIIMDLSELAAYSKEHIAEIISNIHRIRPETKEFLTIE